MSAKVSKLYCSETNFEHLEESLFQAKWKSFLDGTGKNPEGKKRSWGQGVKFALQAKTKGK